MNEDQGFTLVHHLAQLNWELCPGNPIVNKIVAFGDNIQKDATTPNVWVFEGEEHELFFRLHLPDVNLKNMQLFYSNKTKGNNSISLFAMDPATKELGRGPVTRIIPIPMEWASLFVDNPSYGSEIPRMFDLFDSLTKDEQVNRMPILEMMATACCGADNSGKVKSTLLSKWAQLRFHAGTKCWAAEAWAALTSLPVKERAPLPVIPVVQSPENRVRDQFGNRPQRPAVRFPQAATAPLVAPKAAAIGMSAMDMGDMMVKVLKAQVKANLALHESYQTDMCKNIRLTGTAVVATGSSKDTRLTESKLRILRVCSGHNDGLPFTLSKLYIKVEREGGAKDTFHRILRRMAVTVQGSAHKCNIHITPKIVEAVKMLNFSANNDRTFVGCTSGVMPMAVPWCTKDAVNVDIVEERYFEESTFKSPADIRKHATGAKFEPPKTLQGLVRVLTNYVRLLEVLFRDHCPHMLWVQRLPDGLYLHERILETWITPTLIINLLWKVHMDACQFFDSCEKWDDGEALPWSTLQSTVRELVNKVDITTTLTCPVAEFLGPEPSALGPRQQEKRKARGGGGHGRQPTKNEVIPPICAPSVKELNWLYPLMNIMTFARKSGVKYQNLAVGEKGDCTNFGHLGRCPDKNCTFKHTVCTVPESQQKVIKAGLDQGLAALA